MQAQGDDGNPANASICKYRTNPKVSASTGETPQKPVRLQDTESYKQIATLIGRGTQGNKIGACMPCFLYFGKSTLKSANAF